MMGPVQAPGAVCRLRHTIQRADVDSSWNKLSVLSAPSLSFPHWCYASCMLPPVLFLILVCRTDWSELA